MKPPAFAKTRILHKYSKRASNVLFCAAGVSTKVIHDKNDSCILICHASLKSSSARKTTSISISTLKAELEQKLNLKNTHYFQTCLQLIILRYHNSSRQRDFPHPGPAAINKKQCPCLSFTPSFQDS